MCICTQMLYGRVYKRCDANVREMSSSCFLCTFNGHVDAVDMNQFIHENIGLMCTDVLAKEVHAQLQIRQGADCAPSHETVRKHITMHTLNPTVRMGIMLRGLLDLEDKMKGDLYKLDSNGQNLGLDPKMIDAYIRLQNQIHTLYKSKPNEMLFNPNKD
jgi:hypothetical protein